MSKKTFTLCVARVESEAQIDIIGTIGWSEETTYEGFRELVQEAKAQGATKARLYITSPGGSCFHANEIINLLNDEFDTVEGIGGALVASAASYIAVRCSTFSMPENGQFMIHPPSGGEWGKAEELEAYAEMLKNIEADYLKAYQAKA
ncbi:MAG: Clp protease ClpP, partial [Bacteroidales bacterium]